MDYFHLEPFGAWRDNWHAALVANILAAAHTPKNRRAPDFADFFFKDESTIQQERIDQADRFFEEMSNGRSRKARRQS